MKVSAKKGKDSNLWKGGTTRSERLKIADWCATVRSELLINANFKCNRCESNSKLELHHMETVVDKPELAYEKSNLEVLCKNCHLEHHHLNGDCKKWREKHKGNTLTVNWSKVAKVDFVGNKMTYDLEVNHTSHNYVANGIEVHNSQRYAEDQTIDRYKARSQDLKNRQNSIDDLPEETTDWFFNSQTRLETLSMQLYEQALHRGIAKECARFLLPMSTTTKIYMSGTVRSWIHYLNLRCANGTQLEHKEIADDIRKIFIKKFPTLSTALEWE